MALPDVLVEDARPQIVSGIVQSIQLVKDGADTSSTPYYAVIIKGDDGFIHKKSYTFKPPYEIGHWVSIQTNPLGSTSHR
jgi:hypothetical protein